MAMPDQVCPSCGGEGKTIGMFPVYAPGTPPERKRPFIEMKCHFCGGAGTVTVQMLEQRERGRKLREERLSRGMGLRQEAERRGMSPTELSKIEQGVLSDG